MSLKPIRKSRRHHSKWPRLESGHWQWGGPQWRPKIDPTARYFKIGILLTVFLLGITVSAFAYYQNVYVPSVTPPKANYDPFTLLWNGTTPRAMPHGAGPIVFNSKVNATCAVSCGGSPIDTVLLFPSITVSLGDTIVLGFYASHAIVSTFTVKDSQLNSYSLQVSSKHTGLDSYLYTAPAIASGNDVLNLTSSAQNAFAGVVSDYSGGITMGNTGSDFGSGGVGPTSGSSTVTIISQASTSFIIEFMAVSSSGGTGTVTPASSQTLRNEYSTAAAQSSASGDTDITGLSGSQGLKLNFAFSTDQNNWNHVALELAFNSAFTAASACPSGYQCLFSSTDSNGNVQLNAKAAGPTTLDNFHPSPTTSMYNAGNRSLAFSSSFFAQTFNIAGSNWQIASVQFLMNQTNPWTGAWIAQIWNLNGTAGVNGSPVGSLPNSGLFPAGSPLATSNSFTGPLTSVATATTFTFASSPVLSPGSYALSLTDNVSIAPGAASMTGTGTGVANTLVSFQFGDGAPAYAGHNVYLPHTGQLIRTTKAFWFTITGAAASAVAITTSPIDVSTSASKELFFFETWHNSTNLATTSPWGWFITTNATLPVQASYSPLNDSSVVLANVVYPNAGASNKAYYEYMSKTPGQFLQTASGAGINPYPSCPQTSTLFICAGNQNAGVGTTFQSISTTLNYTGNAANAGANGFSLLCVDGTPTQDPPVSNYCSSATQTPTLSPCSGSTQEICATTTLPFLNMQGGPYYLGFWSSVGQSATILFGTSNTGAAAQRANSIWYWVPNPVCPPTCAVTDTGGFFGFLGKSLTNGWNSFTAYTSPIWGPVANVMSGAGSTIANAFVQALVIAGSYAYNGLNAFFQVIVSGLNSVGQTAGWGPIGTNLQTFFGQMIAFFANDVPTIFLNVPALFARFFDTLSVVFPWLPNALTTAQSILLFGVKALVFIPTIVGFAFMFVSGAFATYFIAFWFIYTGDDSLAGILSLFETTEFLIFGIGVRYLAIAFNYTVDIITALIGLIPKPFIQMVSHNFPRIPIIEVNARFVWPGGNMSEIRNGNMFTVACWVTGLLFLDFYESANPALPGSIGFLLPGAVSALAPMAGFIPLLEIMTAFVWGASFLIVPIGWLSNAFDFGDLPVDAAVGTKVSGGFGGIRVAKAQKHFQGRLEKKIEARGMIKRDFQKALSEGRGLEPPALRGPE
jgi:hypothetical protein